MDKKLGDILDNLSKKLGKDIIQDLTDDTLDFSTTDRIPTGSLGYDLALGGGWVMGRIHELAGWESSGKSTACVHAIVEAQKLGHACAYIDSECAYDKDYAEDLGVNTKDLIFSQPKCGEDGLEVAIALAKSGIVKLIIIDSVPALIPRKILEGDVGDQTMGVQARLMSQTLPMLVQAANQNNCAVIFTNQLRLKIGMVFGNPETTSGGVSLGFYSSIRVKQRQSVTKGEKSKDGEQMSSLININVYKNKTHAPHKKAEIFINYGEGFDLVREIIDIGTDLNILQKGGSWYSYGDIKLGQGVRGVKSMFSDNPELFEEIENKVRVALGLIQE